MNFFLTLLLTVVFAIRGADSEFATKAQVTTLSQADKVAEAAKLFNRNWMVCGIIAGACVVALATIAIVYSCCINAKATKRYDERSFEYRN